MSPLALASGLKLVAHDAGDLGILAACLQDSIVHADDCRYDPRGHRFALIASRLCAEDKTAAPTRRVRCLVRVDGVLKVRSRGLRRPAAADDFLVLLTIATQSRDDGRFDLDLTFAGDAAIRLETECIDVSLSDRGQSWPAAATPDHGLGAD